jgi:phosphatidylserine/phosphatidylglycerophosphate/cardiolipin synthase-like enzyme
MPRSWRRLMPTLLGLVVLVALLYLREQQNRAAAPVRPEQQAALAGRAGPAALPASPVAAIGSGGIVKGDWWEIAFTAPKYPDDPADHHGSLDDRLVALIDRATHSVDVAIYDFDLRNVVEALARANQRGARVRLVTDTDTLQNTKDEAIQAAFETLRKAGIPIVDDRKDDIMHDKFTVVDGEWVETGSWNYTDGDTYHLNNNQFIAHSRDLAARYSAEFEQMFAQHRFGADKRRDAPPAPLQIGTSRVEVYFSPEDGIADRLTSLVNRGATRSVDFLAFSFTLDPLGQTLIERSKQGAAVRGVFETTGSNTPASEFGRLKQAGLEVYQDGNPWVMHHKVFILDRRTVAFGSFNFSASADKGNDENILFVEDPSLAEAFRAEFERVLALAQNPPVRKR